MSVRWRPPVAIVALAALAIGYVRLGTEQIAQNKTLASFGIGLLAAALLLLWLLFATGLSLRQRLAALAFVVLGVAGSLALFRIRGVTGDFVPVIEPRWRPKERIGAARVAPPIPMASMAVPAALPSVAPKAASAPATLNDYPQFLGPNRDGTLRGVRLDRNWDRRPPRLVWRQAIGLGWSVWDGDRSCGSRSSV